LDRPDLVVLLINFAGTSKSRAQVAAKDFILGQPAKGVKGKLEEEVGNIACYKFALVKFPVSERQGGMSRARGAVGMFDYIGNSAEVEETIKKMREAWGRAAEDTVFEGSSAEIFLAQKWSR